jgi:hypothetical protein
MLIEPKSSLNQACGKVTTVDCTGKAIFIGFSMHNVCALKGPRHRRIKNMFSTGSPRFYADCVKDVEILGPENFSGAASHRRNLRVAMGLQVPQQRDSRSDSPKPVPVIQPQRGLIA